MAGVKPAPGKIDLWKFSPINEGFLYSIDGLCHREQALNLFWPQNKHARDPFRSACYGDGMKPLSIHSLKSAPNHSLGNSLPRPRFLHDS